MPLSDIAARNAKATERAYKLADGGGLYLLVNPAGRKYWRLKYRFAGSEKLLALGVYPRISLKAARIGRDKARTQLAHGVDPGAERRAHKIARLERASNSFEAIAREWHAKHARTWTPGHAARILRRLEADVFPWIGNRAIAELAAPELLATLRRIESRGAIETAHRAHQNCGQVFRYAVATGRALRDPSADLRGAIPPPQKRHHASITDPKAVGELLRAIAGYQGTLIARCALRLAPLLFVRPGELRKAEWAEFDLDKEAWRIPPERMKMRAPHLVPLSTQAVAILRELYAATRGGRYVFPSVRSTARPMSENTVNAALRRLGYGPDQMTGHGFRSMASTLLNEAGWNRDAIERQLAHAERDEVRAAYNYAEHLQERKRMMQSWADFLDAVAAGAKITGLKRAA